MLGRNKEPRQAKSSSTGGGGSGGKRDEGTPFFVNGKFEFHIDGQKWGWVPLGLAVAVGYFLTRNSANTRHISWQEFRTQYLEKGEVERLQVVDRSVVRVFLRRDASVARSPGVRTNVGHIYMQFVGGGGFSLGMIVILLLYVL